MKLEIRNVGHVPGFKNKKRIGTNRKTGNQFYYTEKRAKDIMNQIIASISYQLKCAYQMTAPEILMGRSLPSWIASSVPLDDCRQWIPSITLDYVECLPGDEGADLELTKLETTYRKK